MFNDREAEGYFLKTEFVVGDSLTRAWVVLPILQLKKQRLEEVK